MLFWIFIIILIAGIVWYIHDEYNGFAVSTLSIGIVGVVVSLLIIGINYFGIDGYVAANNVRYESLVYQYENNIYDNDNDLGYRELIVDIQDWNEDLAKYKETQDNFWIGIYIPNVYDQFEFIELG